MHYFISYQWSKDGINQWITANAVTNLSPMVWLEDTLKFSETYRILFYDQITESEYLSLKDKL